MATKPTVAPPKATFNQTALKKRAIPITARGGVTRRSGAASNVTDTGWMLRTLPLARRSGTHATLEMMIAARDQSAKGTITILSAIRPPGDLPT